MYSKNSEKNLLDISSTRDFLTALLLAGGVVAVMSISPAFLTAALPFAAEYKRRKNKKFQDTFYYLRRKGYIRVESRRGEAHISLTAGGVRAARRGYFKTHISTPRIPRKWDGLWRLIIFDVPSHDHVKRNAFRLLIKRLGATFLQQSVWLYPYDCSEQIGFLKQFFELNDDQVRLIEATNIGDDKQFRKQFKV